MIHKGNDIQNSKISKLEYRNTACAMFDTKILF
jgi:hypothetical protein